MIKRFYNNCVLFFYSFLFKRLFLTKILKMPIITIDIIHYAGVVKKIGKVAGLGAGLSLSSCGIPPFIGGPLGTIIGAFIGDIIDKELVDLNKKIKYIDNKNVKDEKLNTLISSRINEKVNELLDDIIKQLDYINKTNPQQNKDDVLRILTNRIEGTKGDNAKILLNVLKDDRVKKYIYEITTLNNRGV